MTTGSSPVRPAMKYHLYEEKTVCCGTTVIRKLSANICCNCRKILTLSDTYITLAVRKFTLTKRKDVKLAEWLRHRSAKPICVGSNPTLDSCKTN